jgi:vacuolar-type H+-ATPase catalytic subunit A/Vma1
MMARLNQLGILSPEERLEERLRRIEERLEELEKDSHPPIDLRSSIVEILEELKAA